MKASSSHPKRGWLLAATSRCRRCLQAVPLGMLVYLPVCLSVQLPVCLPAHLSTCLSIRPSVCLPVFCLSACLCLLPVRCLSACPSIRLSTCVRLPVPPSVHLPVWLSPSLCLPSPLAPSSSLCLCVCEDGVHCSSPCSSLFTAKLQAEFEFCFTCLLFS